MKTVFDENIYNGFPLPDRKSYSFQCRRKTEMVTRGRVESSFCDNLVFITLTYDSEHLPDTYKKCKDLQIFRQRKTRKKVSVGRWTYDGDYKMIFTDKWITKNSRSLNLKHNVYRHKEIMTQQDFKNAKHKFSLTGYKANKEFGLLVPKHLSDFLLCLRNDMRIKFNDSSLRLRFIANGEYGPNTHRPHYHIVIFSKHFYDYNDFMRTYWVYGRILDCRVVSLTEKSVKKLTAYICGHTVKNDAGNLYQKEMSPAFRLASSFDGGIGYQLLDFKSVDELPKDIDYYDFVRSLKFSLSAWDKKSSVKYRVSANEDVDPKKRVYFEYEFPRYYKDKMLNYLAKDVRQLTESNCTMIKSVITSFCEFYNLHGHFDLLDCYLNIGLCKTPSDILTFFMISNRNKLPKYLADLNLFPTFAKRFFAQIRENDSLARNVFKKRYENRKQEKRYQEFLQNNHFENID